MHALLWLPAGFILACLPVVFFLIPDSTTRDRDRIDWFGPSLLSLGLGAALLGLARGVVGEHGSAPRTYGISRRIRSERSGRPPAKVIGGRC